MYKASRSG